MTTTTTVSKVVLEKQPIEVFEIALPGGSPTNTWMRRLIVLGVGIGMIGMYLGYRRHSKSKSKQG